MVSRGRRPAMAVPIAVPAIIACAILEAWVETQMGTTVASEALASAPDAVVVTALQEELCLLGTRMLQMVMVMVMGIHQCTPLPHGASIHSSVAQLGSHALSTQVFERN